MGKTCRFNLNESSIGAYDCSVSFLISPATNHIPVMLLIVAFNILTFIVSFLGSFSNSSQQTW